MLASEVWLIVIFLPSKKPDVLLTPILTLGATESVEIP